MIWIGPYGILPALRTALGHDCRPSAARRADNHDRGPFCGPSKFHNALTNHVIVIAERPLTLVREAQPLYYARMYMRVANVKLSVPNNRALSVPYPCLRKHAKRELNELVSQEN